jgi:hypothetical protein
MCVSTAVGALAAFKALVQARGQLAASGCDLFLSRQLTQPLDAACPFVGGSTGSSSNGQEGCCSSSAVVLWAVAVPAAPADALPANIGPVLAAQSHKQHAKQQQQQQQQPKQQQLRQQQQPMQPLEPQAAAQTHAMTHTPSLQQQQQVHTAAAPSGVCLPVALPPLQHCTPSTHGLRANGNGNSKLCEIVQLPEQLQPC